MEKENELLGKELMSLSAKKKQQSTDDEIGHDEAIIMEQQSLIEENRQELNKLVQENQALQNELEEILGVLLLLLLAPLPLLRPKLLAGLL